MKSLYKQMKSCEIAEMLCFETMPFSYSETTCLEIPLWLGFFNLVFFLIGKTKCLN